MINRIWMKHEEVTRKAMKAGIELARSKGHEDDMEEILRLEVNEGLKILTLDIIFMADLLVVVLSYGKKGVVLLFVGPSALRCGSAQLTASCDPSRICDPVPDGSFQCPSFLRWFANSVYLRLICRPLHPITSHDPSCAIQRSQLAGIHSCTHPNGQSSSVYSHEHHLPKGA